MEYQTTIYRKNIPLKAKINLPNGEDGDKYPLVILCHGHSRHMDDGLNILAEFLAEQGISSLRFNFSGCGENSPNRYRLYCHTDWIEDLIKVIDFAHSVPNFDIKRIGLAGISMGASTILSVSGIDKRIKCSVAMAPVDDCFPWLKKIWKESAGDWEWLIKRVEFDSVVNTKTGTSQLIETLDMYNDSEVNKRNHRIECQKDPELNNFVSLDSINSLFQYRPLKYCSEIQIPVFLINGEEDTLVPIECSENIKKAIKGGEVKHKIYANVDHNIPICNQRGKVFDDIVRWFKIQLFK